MKSFFSLLITTKIIMAFIRGGTSYQPGLVGLEPYSSNSITSSKTVLTVTENKCHFKTIYTTSEPDSLFLGKLYSCGLQKVYSLKEIKIRKKEYDDNYEIEENFTDIFSLYIYDSKYTITKTDIQSQTGTDSTLTIEGVIELQPSIYWGAGGYSHFAQFRHLIFSEEKTNKERRCIYLFAPTQEYPCFKEVQLEVHNKHKKREVHLRTGHSSSSHLLLSPKDIFHNSEDIYHSTILKPNSCITYAYRDSVPQIATLSFSDRDPSFKKSFFNIGGPIIGAGSRYFAVWEFLLLPPSNSTTAGLASIGINGEWGEEPELELGSGINVLWLLNPRILYFPSRNQWEWGVGINFFSLGFEIRNRGWYTTLSF